MIEFHTFCHTVLKLTLTPAQNIVAKCAFGPYNPADLVGDEKALAVEMFGGVEDFPESCRHTVVLTFGRGSGKTLLAAAFGLYKLFTTDLTGRRKVDIPIFPVFSLDKATAQLSVDMAYELAMDEPLLKKSLVSRKNGILTFKRPDGWTVRMMALAMAPRGGKARGKPILSFLLDEAEFLQPDEDGKYVVTDADVYKALTPRLLPGGIGALVSTPWPSPVPTLTQDLRMTNFGKPKDAIVAKATTVQMRGYDPEVVAMVERERQRDPENAAREFDCEDTLTGGGGFFDAQAIEEACTIDPVEWQPGWPTCLAVDLAFSRDSTAIAVVTYDGSQYHLVHIEEIIPKPGKPLKPSEVFARIRNVADKYNTRSVVADIHYREALREALAESGISILPAPEGALGKEEMYVRTKAVLHQGRICIPRVRKLIAQMRAVIARPSPGGRLTIRSPRRAGGSHGDLVSALVAATHRLMYAYVEQVVQRPKANEPGYEAWFHQRYVEQQEQQEAKFLKTLERRARLGHFN